MTGDGKETEKRHELRDAGEARRYLLQGLWLQHVVPPAAATVRPALEWAQELISEGQPLPPLGLVADIGQRIFTTDEEDRAMIERVAVPGLPANLRRNYEDYVLGKLDADSTFARASDALRHYEERDQARGLAFLIEQFRERAGFPGVTLSPAGIKSLQALQPEEVITRGWESLSREGVMPRLIELYEEMIGSTRRMAEVLEEEDVFELEHRTALAGFGQRVALRQVLQAARRLDGTLPRHRLRPLSRRQEVPTRIFDEDTYPVGGFAAISTRGTIESLLHSQLVFMERTDRPDLFDIKYLRDELLYYARDENQFLRRRRTFIFIFFPDLVRARFKDANLPYQRGILLLAMLLVIVRKLSEWLSTDALTFEFLFPFKGDVEPLKPERELVEMLLREQIANHTVEVKQLSSAAELVKLCAERSRRSLCHCLTISTSFQSLEAEEAVVTCLQLDAPSPALRTEEEDLAWTETSEPMDGWNAALQHLLKQWI